MNDLRNSFRQYMQDLDTRLTEVDQILQTWSFDSEFAKARELGTEVELIEFQSLLCWELKRIMDNRRNQIVTWQNQSVSTVPEAITEADEAELRKRMARASSLLQKCEEFGEAFRYDMFDPANYHTKDELEEQIASLQKEEKSCLDKRDHKNKNEELTDFLEQQIVVVQQRMCRFKEALSRLDGGDHSAHSQNLIKVIDVQLEELARKLPSTDVQSAVAKSKELGPDNLYQLLSLNQIREMQLNTIQKRCRSGIHYWQSQTESIILDRNGSEEYLQLVALFSKRLEQASGVLIKYKELIRHAWLMYCLLVGAPTTRVEWEQELAGYQQALECYSKKTDAELYLAEMANLKLRISRHMEAISRLDRGLSPYDLLC